MIKIILLKEAKKDSSYVFAKAVVENNGFELPIATGMLKKTKDLVATAGTVVFELPDLYLGKVVAVTRDFQPEGSDEIKQYTTLEIA